MGFLSKLMKNPLVQMALPMAMTYFMPWAAGATGMTGLMSGMNPMARNMLMQSAMGYGTAALSGSKRPEKAAMYAGLASLPFSYMSAAQSANAFNKQYAGIRGDEMFQKTPGIPGYSTSISPNLPISKYVPPVKPTWGVAEMTSGAGQPRISAWDILSGKYKEGVQLPDLYRDVDPLLDKEGKWFQEIKEGLTPADDKFISRYGKIATPDPIPVDASIFSKTSQGGTGFGGRALPEAGTKTVDWMPTMASQAAGMYGGRMTPEEEWEASKKKRKKELAWMYGVPEDMIEGEMTNPWSSGSFWNRGGISSLQNGGDVSGPGTGTSDSINANLSDGEFVMTAKAVENLGGGDRYTGARKMYDLMNVLDPESESMSEVV